MVKLVLQWVMSSLLFLSPVVLAGDSTYYGRQSTTSYFACTSVGNCTWWAAYMRPDLAAKRTGSGWNGGQWYDKFRDLGVPVGLEPRVGAIVEFASPGHVAYVEKVNGDGSFDVTEMDSTGSLGSGGVYRATYHPDGNGKFHRNNGAIGGWTLKGFIYKETCNPSQERCQLKINGPVGWFPAVSDCQQANQWFNMATVNGEKTVVGSTTRSACPLVCYAN